MRTAIFVSLLTVSVAIIITATLYVSSHRRPVVQKRSCENVTVVGPKLKDFRDGELMTPDEMLAVRYAKGKMGQSISIDELLKKRRNGFFIECGAWDGEELSNSLFFEQHRNWTGIIIENDPTAYETLLKKNRTVYTYHGCLSPTGRSEMLPFRPEHLYSGVAGFIPNFNLTNGTRLTSLFCVPLNDLLAAMGINHVDFLSLDIEGAESEVLRNFDFTAVRVDAMTVEYGTVRLQKIRDAVLPTGLYREAKLVGTLDVIFIREDII